MCVSVYPYACLCMCVVRVFIYLFINVFVLFNIVGEYVIIVEDVTNPPFLGTTLEPAFLLVKVVLPKKSKRRTTGSNVKGPKYVSK